ncbi:sulfite exporter TauE/SafE family protein [Caldimonas tepidiphila]|uniref:sulfite exporter TauE/SafE family protein n=1 Tax=Caldimonas tepidiphila TaxID=2315841 RepID=UPI000E5C2563|nr:sulfite exporter TauE/SafE family protein [Caldimonas tepidiphila]
MLSSLLLTALLMGLAGGPHCIAMCGAASAGVVSGCGVRRQQGLLAFQGGRVFGYGLLGAIVAASAQALQWGAANSALLKPFWGMFHLSVALLGLWLLWSGRQPAWLDGWARRVWERLRWTRLEVAGQRWPGALRAATAGGLWAFLPCGLLYSALMVAALAPSPLGGAAVMAAFAAGSGLALHLVPAFWLWWRGRGAAAAASQNTISGAAAVRVAGLALASASFWAVGHALWLEYGARVCR